MGEPGLADTGIALHQQRAPQREGQVHRFLHVLPRDIGLAFDDLSRRGPFGDRIQVRLLNGFSLGLRLGGDEPRRGVHLVPGWHAQLQLSISDRNSPGSGVWRKNPSDWSMCV